MHNNTVSQNIHSHSDADDDILKNAQKMSSSSRSSKHLHSRQQSSKMASAVNMNMTARSSLGRYIGNEVDADAGKFDSLSYGAKVEIRIDVMENM